MSTGLIVGLAMIWAGGAGMMPIAFYPRFEGDKLLAITLLWPLALLLFA